MESKLTYTGCWLNLYEVHVRLPYLLFLSIFICARTELNKKDQYKIYFDLFWASVKKFNVYFKETGHYNCALVG